MKINPQLIVPIPFVELEKGSLGIVVADHARFLGGDINGTEVMIALDGEEPFHVAERRRWSRGTSLEVDDISFEVETSSASVIDRNMDLQPGMLFRHRAGISVIGKDNHHAQIVDVVGSFDAEIRGKIVGFSEWSIFTGEDEQRTLLFEHKGEAAA